MIQVFHDENVESTIEQEIETKVEGKQRDLSTTDHNINQSLQYFNPLPPASYTSTSTLSTSQSSSHSFQSSSSFHSDNHSQDTVNQNLISLSSKSDHLQKRKTSESSSTTTSSTAAAAEMATRNPTFHRQTRSIVDIIVAVEKSTIKQQRPILNNQNNLTSLQHYHPHYSPQQQLGISSILSPIENQYEHYQPLQSIGFTSRSSSNSSSSIINQQQQQQQELIPLPPPPKPNATKQEHHRYFYALRKATRSRKQQLQQQQQGNQFVQSNTTGAGKEIKSTFFEEDQLKSNQTQSQLSNYAEALKGYKKEQNDNHDKTPLYSTKNSFSSPSLSSHHFAMMAWHKSSLNLFGQQRSNSFYNQNHHHQKEFDHDFLMEILHSDDQETKLLFGELNETRKLQHAELGF